MSQGLAPVPLSILGYVEDQIQNPNSGNDPASQLTAASSSSLKRKRNLPDPDAEVVALSPNSLMATNKFLCEVCNKGFQRDQNLQLHRRGHNLPWKLKQRSNKEIVKKKVYICPEKSCVHNDPSRALGDLTGIKKHFSRKHGEKKWKCDKCPKKYAVKSDWKAHSKICGTREHKCDCGAHFSRKDSFITHRAFCTAAVDQSGSRFPAPSAVGTNNPLSLRNDFLSGNFGNPQMIDTHQFSGTGNGGFYPELSSSNFHPYGHVINSIVDGSKSAASRPSQWLENHPLNVSAHWNPNANLSHELFLQHAGQSNNNVFESSSSSHQTPWLDKCSDQSAFGNNANNMSSSLDQMIAANTSGGGMMMQVKREAEILSNEDFVENMTALYNASNLNHHQQQQQAMTNNESADQLFLSSFLGGNTNNNNSVGNMSSRYNGQEIFSNNNGFGFCNSSFSRPHHVSKDSDTASNAENMNYHLMLMHEADAGMSNKQEEAKQIINTTQHEVEEGSKTRDFLGVGGNEMMMSREEKFERLAAAGASEQSLRGNSSSAAEQMDSVPHYYKGQQ